MNTNDPMKETVETVDWNSRLADEGRWQQVRGRIRQTWGTITDDELDNARGLVGSPCRCDQGEDRRSCRRDRRQAEGLLQLIERKLRFVFRPGPRRCH